MTQYYQQRDTEMSKNIRECAELLRGIRSDSLASAWHIDRYNALLAYSLNMMEAFSLRLTFGNPHSESCDYASVYGENTECKCGHYQMVLAAAEWCANARQFCNLIEKSLKRKAGI